MRRHLKAKSFDSHVELPKFVNGWGIAQEDIQSIIYIEANRLFVLFYWSDSQY